MAVFSLVSPYTYIYYSSTSPSLGLGVSLPQRFVLPPTGKPIMEGCTAGYLFSEGDGLLCKFHIKRNVPPWSAGLATRSVVGFVGTKVLLFSETAKQFEGKCLFGGVFLCLFTDSSPKTTEKSTLPYVVSMLCPIHSFAVSFYITFSPIAFMQTSASRARSKRASCSRR